MDETQLMLFKKNGGAERIRTAYPLVANEVLYQMSYDPTPLTKLLCPTFWHNQGNFLTSVLLI